MSGELGPDDCVALEVTTNAFTIARLLLPSGARVSLSDPMRTRIIAESKFKNDQLDARKLAELDRVDYLPKVWLPDPETETLPHLLSQRQSLVDRRTEQKNRIHALLHRYLLRFPGTDEAVKKSSTDYSDFAELRSRRWLALEFAPFSVRLVLLTFLCL